MRLSILLSSLAVCGLFLTSPVLAESDNSNNDYRLPTYDKIKFEAEASGDHKVYMNWSAFEGHNDEKFEYYKVIRSHGNPNPVYPEDDAIKYLDGLGDTRYTDENAWKSAYYRVCVITDVKGRHCSNVVWVEIEKTDKEEKPDCKKWSASGECEMTYDQYKEQKEQERFEWEKKQDEAKDRLDAKKEEMKAHQAAQREKWAAEREAAKEKQMAKKDEWHEKKTDREAEVWKKLYEKLDAWLERLGERLEKSDLTNAAKVEKIEKIQERFYQWEEGKEMRMRMVDYIDETLNEWKKIYSQDDEFGEIDSFLDGLLD